MTALLISSKQNVAQKLRDCNIKIEQRHFRLLTFFFKFRNNKKKTLENVHESSITHIIYF